MFKNPKLITRLWLDHVTERLHNLSHERFLKEYEFECCADDSQPWTDYEPHYLAAQAARDRAIERLRARAKILRQRLLPKPRLP